VKRKNQLEERNIKARKEIYFPINIFPELIIDEYVKKGCELKTNRNKFRNITKENERFQR
jgi:hypothetical protein